LSDIQNFVRRRHISPVRLVGLNQPTLAGL
jgi:hypothetical protein